MVLITWYTSPPSSLSLSGRIRVACSPCSCAYNGIRHLAPSSPFPLRHSTQTLHAQKGGRRRRRLAPSGLHQSKTKAVSGTQFQWRHRQACRGICQRAGRTCQLRNTTTSCAVMDTTRQLVIDVARRQSNASTKCLRHSRVIAGYGHVVARTQSIRGKNYNVGRRP